MCAVWFLGECWLQLFITNPASGAEADPVVALKELLKVVERDGTPTRVTDFSKGTLGQAALHRAGDQV